jgi:protein tyrosine/serine phosphatase
VNVLALLLAFLFAGPSGAQSAAAPLRWRTPIIPAAEENAPDGAEPCSDEVPHLRVVEPGLYRSGRPGCASYARLRALGIRTILNLEGRRVARGERRRAAQFPEIRVVNVPLSGWHQPSFEQLDDALQVLATAPRPILVHCRHGEDRTGVVVAAYRVALEQRSVPEAAREARTYHCCHMLTDRLDELLDGYIAYRAGR